MCYDLKQNYLRAEKTFQIFMFAVYFSIIRMFDIKINLSTRTKFNLFSYSL